MFTAILLVSSLGQTLVFPPLVKVGGEEYYDANPPADLPAVLRHSQNNTTIILTKNVLGIWEGTKVLPKPVEFTHPVTGVKTMETTFVYRLRKEMLAYKWRDKTTQAWWYTASVFPQGMAVPENNWCAADQGFRFSPFFYGRAHIGVIQE